MTILPNKLLGPLSEHLRRTRSLYETDIREGTAGVALSNALVRKYPSAQREWTWCWAFPATPVDRDRETGEGRRHHLHETVVQRAVGRAALEMQIPKRISCHTFRRTFATVLLEAGYGIRTSQELLGHRDVTTTMIYTHLVNQGPRAVRRPIDD